MGNTGVAGAVGHEPGRECFSMVEPFVGCRGVAGGALRGNAMGPGAVLRDAGIGVVVRLLLAGERGATSGSLARVPRSTRARSLLT
jgi:hypothetical protein